MSEQQSEPETNAATESIPPTQSSSDNVAIRELESDSYLAPTRRLSGRGLLLLLLAVCLVPLFGLTLYAIQFGRAAEHKLPVGVELKRDLVPTQDGGGAMLADVVAITNLSDVDIPNVTINLNGQYFLYRESPLVAGDTLVVPQQIFATKANQRFVPGRYPIETVMVTGKLPSGARGVTEIEFPLADE